jgi:protein-S-isoprenylcysteine O-methyltransferase Ste14
VKQDSFPARTEATEPVNGTGTVPKTVLLFLLAAVFTAGLTFATVELPELVDGFLQRAIPTPGGDSHADEVALLKTELFIAHFHVRMLGYAAFFLLVALIAAGLATRRTGLAALGAFGVMLPVFAQFAGVMFFLAGLGVLNAVWMPILDVSWELQNLGLVIEAPNDLLRWLLARVGVHSIWPTTLFFIGAGILLFLAGVYAWLSARAGEREVADSLAYRLSRHPQYLGWILWTYGAYLLLQRMHYPRRSWGIGASLPWLLSTMVIVAVALVEELHMRERYGEAWERYRRSAPFLVPLPRFLRRLFAAPFRLLFGKEWPDRTREVVVVVGLYTMLLMGCSLLFYDGDVGAVVARRGSPAAREAAMRDLVAQLREAPDYRGRYHRMTQLASFGEAAVDPLVDLLRGEDAGLSRIAAEGLERIASGRAIGPLSAALASPEEDLRNGAVAALGAIGSREALPALLPMLDDPVLHVRLRALRVLAALGAREVLERAPEYLASESEWVRSAGVAAVGSLGAPEGVPLLAGMLDDPSPQVRREAVVALLRSGQASARPALERARRDEDWEVRVYAAEALERLPRADETARSDLRHEPRRSLT